MSKIKGNEGYPWWQYAIVLIWAALMTYGVIRAQFQDDCSWTHERGLAELSFVSCRTISDSWEGRFDVLGLAITMLSVLLAFGALMSLNAITENAISRVVEKASERLDGEVKTKIDPLEEKLEQLISGHKAELEQLIAQQKAEIEPLKARLEQLISEQEEGGEPDSLGDIAGGVDPEEDK